MKYHSRTSLILGFLMNIGLLYSEFSNTNLSSEFDFGIVLIAAATSIAFCTLATEFLFKENYLSIFSLPVCLAMLVLSSIARGKIAGGHFFHPWLMAHLLASFSGESLFALAAISSASYLYVVRRLKKKNRLKAVAIFPPLTRLDNLTFKLLAIGTITFFIGLAIGIYGNFNYFNGLQPTGKHYLSAIVLGYYTGILALKRTLNIAGPRLAIASLIGFLLSLVLIVFPSNQLHWQPFIPDTGIGVPK
ncbi:MAG: hypothetical protein Kow0029_15100 [Candidatus Rifleibacteriota bacterium]